MGDWFVYFLFFSFIFMALILGGIILKTKLLTPHRLLLRDPVAGRDFARLFHIKEVTRKDGTRWWQTWPIETIVTPAPPAEAIEIMPGGKKYAEAYEITRDQLAWIKDGGLDSDKGKEVMAALQPFTSTDRTILVDEAVKSEMEKGKKFLSPEFILPAMAIAIPCMVLIIAAFMAPDIFKSIHGMQAKSIEFEDKMIQITGMQAKITEAMGLKTGVSVAQTVPAAQGNPTIPTTGETPPTANEVTSAI